MSTYCPVIDEEQIRANRFFCNITSRIKRWYISTKVFLTNSYTFPSLDMHAENQNETMYA